MAISFGGLGNGVDFGQVVTELVKVQRQPIDKLNAAKADLQKKLTDYGELGTKLLALQSAASRLRLPSSFDQSTSTVSDEKVLGGTIIGGRGHRQLYGSGHPTREVAPDYEQGCEGRIRYYQCHCFRRCRHLYIQSRLRLKSGGVARQWRHTRNE